MWDFSIARTFGLIFRTLPFLVLRGLVYFGIVSLIVLATVAGVSVGHGIGLLGGGESGAMYSLWGGLAGFLVASGAVFLQRGQLFYRIHVGHIALVVDYLDRRPVPAGPGQIAYARAVLSERIGPLDELALPARLIHGVVAQVAVFVDDPGDLMPVPGLNRVGAVVGAYLRLSIPAVREVILAQAIRARSEKTWEASHDALVLYTQNARQILTRAAGLTLLAWCLTALVFVATLGPAASVTELLLGHASALHLVVALLFAWAVKGALIDVFVLASLTQVFLNITDGQLPQHEWRGRLTHVSEKFRQLGAHAMTQ